MKKNIKFFAIICVLTIVMSAFSFAASAGLNTFANKFLNATTGAWVIVSTNNPKTDNEQNAYVKLTSRANTSFVLAKVSRHDNGADRTSQVTIANVNTTYVIPYTTYVSGGTAMDLQLRATSQNNTVGGRWNS